MVTGSLMLCSMPCLCNLIMRCDNSQSSTLFQPRFLGMRLDRTHKTYVSLFLLVSPTHQSFSGTSPIGAQHRTLGWVTAGSSHTHQQEERTSVRWEEPDPRTGMDTVSCEILIHMQ